MNAVDSQHGCRHELPELPGFLGLVPHGRLVLFDVLKSHFKYGLVKFGWKNPFRHGNQVI